MLYVKCMELEINMQKRKGGGIGSDFVCFKTFLWYYIFFSIINFSEPGQFIHTQVRTREPVDLPFL